jgi:hypothetical protein
MGIAAQRMNAVPLTTPMLYARLSTQKPLRIAFEWSASTPAELLLLLCTKLKPKVRGFSPQANYTDRATADGGEVSAKLLWI